MIKGVCKTIENEAKEQKEGIISMLLGTLAASLLRNLLTVKGVKAKIPGQGIIRLGEERPEQARIFNPASSFN